MAEIKIEKKKPIWLWIILLLIVAALLFYLFSRNKEQDTAVAATNTDTAANLLQVKENNNTVADYIAFVRDTTNAKMTLDHDFSSEALTRLTNATEAMANAVNYDVKADLDRAKSGAEQITEEPLAGTHADTIKAGASLITGTLQRLQQAKYPELGAEVANLRMAENAINPATLTLDQKQSVKEFFRKAADLLEKMN